jgi:hypothetical protein
MATTNVKTHTGNRIVVVFDSQEIGLVQSVRMNDDYGHEDASGIGDIHVQEHVPTVARHQLTYQQMVLKKTNARLAGIAPENGTAVLRGLVFDLVVKDKDSGRILRKYIGCSYVSGDLEIQKHAIVSGSGTLKALDVTGTGA